MQLSSTEKLTSVAICLLLLINVIKQTKGYIFSASMVNHPVQLDYLLLEGVEGPQMNCVVMANHPVIQHKISQTQMKIIQMKIQPIHEAVTSQSPGCYSFYQSYFAWWFYTLREKIQLKMTNQNTKFSILLVQSFRSAEHQNLSSNFVQNVILKLRIRIVNICVFSNLYNWCTLTLVYVVSEIYYVSIKYINQHVLLYLKCIYNHNFTPHSVITIHFYLIKNIFKRGLLSVFQHLNFESQYKTNK